MLNNLCEAINKYNGATGNELMAYVFFTYAMYADLIKKNNTDPAAIERATIAEQYFSKRCNECWALHKKGL